jgi:hypothetical protein
MNELSKLIKNEKYDIGDIRQILKPINKILSNKSFMKNFMDIVDFIVKDRNNDKKFTMKDIVLLSKNIFAIGSIVKALIYILISIPQINIKCDIDALEEIVLNIFIYLFLVVVPKETGINWTYKEKKQILQTIVTIYATIISGDIVKKYLTKAMKWINNFDGMSWIKHFLSCGYYSKPNGNLRTCIPKIHNKIQRHMDFIRDI